MRRILFFIIAALLTCQVYAQPLPEGAPGASSPQPAAVSGNAAQAQPDAPPAAAASPAAPAANGEAGHGLAAPAADSLASPSITAAGASGTPKITMTPAGKKTGSPSPKPLKRADFNEKMPHAEHVIMLDASSRMQEAGYGNLQSGFKGAPAFFADLLHPDGKYFHSRDAVTIIPFSNLQNQAVDGHNAMGNLKLSDFAKVLMSGSVHGPGNGELKGGLIKPLSRAFAQKMSGVRFFWIFTKQDLNLEDKNNSTFFSVLRNSKSVNFVWYAPLKVMPGAKEEACLYLIAAGASPEHSPWLEGFIDTLNERIAKQVPGSQFIRLKVFAQNYSKQRNAKSVIPLMAYFFRTRAGENVEAPFVENGRYVLNLKPDGNKWKASIDFDIFYPDGWKFAKSSLFPKTGNGHTVTKNKKDSRLVKVETEQTVTEPDEKGRAHVHWDIRVSDISVRRYLLRSEGAKGIDVKISIKDKTKYKYGSGEEGTFCPDASFLEEKGFEDLAKLMIFDDKGKSMDYELSCHPISLRLVADDSHTASSMLTLGGAVLVIASLMGFALGNRKKVKPASEPSGSADASELKPEGTPADSADKPADGSSEAPGAETGSASEENSSSSEYAEVQETPADNADADKPADNADVSESAGSADASEPKPETESAADATSAEETAGDSAGQPSE